MTNSRKFSFIFFLFVVFCSLNAQEKITDDKIIQKNGKEIIGKVLSINIEKVKIDPKGPMSLKIIDVASILKIEFANGEVLQFPLDPNYKFEAENKQYDSPVPVKTKKEKIVTLISFVTGPYQGDNTDPVLGIKTRFNDEHVYGLKGAVFYPEMIDGSLGLNAIFSFAKYTISSEIFGKYREIMDGTAINFDMSGEYALFDVQELYMPNPYILLGFGFTRFVGEDVSELDLSVNFGGGLRILLGKNFGIGFNYKKRPVWVKDMGSPNFTELSGEIYYQK